MTVLRSACRVEHGLREVGIEVAQGVRVVREQQFGRLVQLVRFAQQPEVGGADRAHPGGVRGQADAVDSDHCHDLATGGELGGGGRAGRRVAGHTKRWGGGAAGGQRDHGGSPEGARRDPAEPHRPGTQRAAARSTRNTPLARPPEWGRFGAVVLQRSRLVIQCGMPARAHHAPPRHITAVVGHDLPDAARRARTDRGRDIAVAHDPARRDLARPRQVREKRSPRPVRSRAVLAASLARARRSSRTRRTRVNPSDS